MGGSTKVDSPKAAPTMQEQYASWLKAYPKLQPLLEDAAQEDLSSLAGLYEGGSADALSAAMRSAGKLDASYGEAVEGKTASAMRQLLAEQIYGDLQAGSSLSPEQSRELEQYVRGAQVGRGITGGNAAIFEEAATKGTAGINLANSRRAAAQDFLNFNASKPSSLNAILGISDGVYAGNADIMQGAVAQNNQNALQNQQLKYNASQANAMAQAQANKGLGSMIGTVGGAGLGLALAPATGGTSALLTYGGIGAMGGNMMGGGIGGMF